ncbi:threonine-phosphate decarboxylase CobD [Rhodovulum sp. DZ06]|uniref:threonine-phosphate decarboxylase CobD n=1 Tax=Rhodovulum sp. DZ06 TaxID=3425126 RepID=UPI003D34612C
MRDHGGDLDAAIARHGGAAEAWVDLSTGINAVPYPVPKLSAHAWGALPTKSDLRALEDAARAAYGAGVRAIPLAGASGAIQLAPLLAAPGKARVLGPTYNEHAAALATAGWAVETVSELAALEGADLAVVVNPNNPDGRSHAPEALLALAPKVGLLVVDESFADTEDGLSVIPAMTPDTGGLLVMRSFGKFYGLAGLRLGFALAGDALAGRIAELAGPWPVSGAAVEIGCKALADRAWQDATTARLREEAARLDALAARAGWTLVGGSPLFRTYETGDAQAAQERLAKARTWSRIFPYSEGWIRLGLPGDVNGWLRLEVALGG